MFLHMQWDNTLPSSGQAMEMKLEGFYVARGLSFKCAAVPGSRLLPRLLSSVLHKIAVQLTVQPSPQHTIYCVSFCSKLGKCAAAGRRSSWSSRAT